MGRSRSKLIVVGLVFWAAWVFGLPIVIVVMAYALGREVELDAGLSEMSDAALTIAFLGLGSFIWILIRRAIERPDERS